MYLNTENIDIVEEDGKDERVLADEKVGENSNPDLDMKGQDYGKVQEGWECAYRRASR